MDWITRFLEEVSDVRSPPSFKLWTAITIISAVLERRVYVWTDAGVLYPNMITVLTGPPAAGKGLMITEAVRLWKTVKGLHLGPDNPTKKSMLEYMENKAIRTIINGSGEPLIYSAISFPCFEFNVLFPRYDIEFLATVTHIYDNPDTYTAPRSTTTSIDLQKPTMNMLIGATPDALAETIHEVAWGQGFTSRLTFIYGAKPPNTGRNLFAKRKALNMGELVPPLQSMFELQGEFEWDADAQLAMNTWVESGMEPRPEYGRLKHYVERREAHTLKLAMISAISAGHTLTVTLSDFERAKLWLLEAEKSMPDVFRAMGQKSDAQLIRDLHYALYTEWAKAVPSERKPIHESFIFEFLKPLVPSERIKHIIEVAERSRVMRKGAYPDEWIPRPLSDVKIDT